MALNFPKTVPMLPGHMFDDPYKESFHKTQQFSIQNGIVQEKTNFIEEQLDENLLQQLKTATPLNLTYGQKQKPDNDYIPRVQPQWLKYDRKVLRYSAFFQEPVVENPKENYRIRKCLIYYYLDDDTVYITEPKIENSGIPQGVFVKRQKIPKNLGNYEEYLHWKDFNVGISIQIFERVFRVTDCDTFTQQFYNDMGVKLNSPEILPLDKFEINYSLKNVKIPLPDTKEYKEYFEVKLGGGHPNNGLQKYLENDRKVLSFDILWDDQTLEGQQNYFKLNYFLADNTVEVKEQVKSNSGKDPFPLLLRRQKLPKDPILTHYPGMTLQKEQYYEPQDLTCGKMIKIYYRNCLIFDCDEFTSKWYQQNLGIQQKPLSLSQQKQKKFYQQVPPYNGYGNEQDSLGSVYSLQPKPPKKDIKKMFEKDQYILRFESRMISSIKDDNQRKFIISFYCGDDTIQVFETADRNSGMWEGKFVQRALQKNPITGQQYTEKDFQIGAIITINIYKFQLMRADEFTHQYMKERPETFPQVNITSVLEKLKKHSKNYKNFDEFTIDLLRKLDKNKNGSIEFEELAAGMKELGFNLSYQEQYTLMRHFDTNGDWKLSLKELYDGLAG